jgi:death-on-curing protein
MATRLLFGIAINHPFQQGNKRTGFHAMNAFLFKNGFRLTPLDDITWALAITAVIEHQATEDMFQAWLAPKLVTIEKVRD